MTQEAANLATVLTFPIQQMEDLSDCWDMNELDLQVRLAGVRLLNLITTGVVVPTEAIRKSFEYYNNLCLENGYPPLVYDF